jgi:Polyketide cyclase / dehydrase and lipid transport
MPVSPQAIWDVLASAGDYRHWVVGSKEVRGADDGFPVPGTRFYHSVGVGPLTVRDHTEVIAADPPLRLQLRAKARPLGTARVTLEIEPDGNGGASVRMSERPDGIYAPLSLNPLVHLLTKLRNAESLRRLECRAMVKSARRSA